MLGLRSLCLVGVLVLIVLSPRAPAAAASRLPPPVLLQQASLAAGAKAERDGDYAGAEAQYRALATAADPTVKSAGELALGRFLERRGRSSAATQPLQAAVTAMGGTPDGLRALFLLGEAQADQQQNQAAVASFQAYLAGGGPATGFAALEQAWALQAAGDDRGALAVLAGPLQAASVTVLREALLAAAQSLEHTGAPAQAAADQVAFAATGPSGTKRANALLEAGRLYDLAGDGASAAQVLLQLVQLFPGEAAAGTALDRLDAFGIAVDPFQRAFVLFSVGRNAAAQTAFQQLLAASPTGHATVQAIYYLARIADRQDRNDAALACYAQALELEPNGSLAAGATWQQGQLLYSLNRFADAQRAFSSLAQQFPADSNATEAAFDAGLMAYLDNRAAEAAAIWAPLAQGGASAAAARANVWLGKIALDQGDRRAASADFALAQRQQPSGYFGLRAEVLAGDATVTLGGPAASRPADDWPGVEAWLAAYFGPENTAMFTALQATQDWTEGLELDALGWQITPNNLLGSALAGVAQQPWALYRALRALTARGRTNLALDAANTLLALTGIHTGGPLAAPATLLRVAYPLDYLDLLNQDAKQTNLDPLLVAALARQESAFDPAAGSSAGAQGLLQLEPSTAKDVAGTLGLNSFSATDLLRPTINLQLGVAFLAGQAAAAGYDFNRSLAAYNAGGGSAGRWARRASADPDRFYEAIDYDETRLYLRLVSSNYGIYNALYRNASHPTLFHQ